MSGESIEIMWPSYLKPIKILGKTGDWGILKAKYNTGKEIRRSFQETELASLNFSVYLDPNLSDEYAESLKFLQYICGGLNPFWFNFQHLSTQLEVIVGVGDGSRTTWVVPMVPDTPASVYPSLDKVPTSLYTLHSGGPNLFTGNESEVLYTEFGTTGTGTKSDDPAASSSFPFGLNNAMQLNSVTTNYLAQSVDGGIPAVNGDTFTSLICGSADAVLSHKMVSVVRFLDAAFGSLTAQTATPVDMDVSGKRFLVSTTFTAANALTAWIGWRGGQNAIGSGDAHYHCAAVTNGDLKQIWHGADNLPVIEFDSAPASGVTIRARSPLAAPVLYMVADSVSGSLNAIGAREVKVKIREIIHG